MREIHIASCVAYVKPESLQPVIRSITATGIAEVPRADAGGKLVLLIEKPTSHAIIDAIEAIRALDGVLAVHLAYQHCEPESDIEETP